MEWCIDEISGIEHGVLAHCIQLIIPVGPTMVMCICTATDVFRHCIQVVNLYQHSFSLLVNLRQAQPKQQNDTKQR